VTTQAVPAAAGGRRHGVELLRELTTTTVLLATLERQIDRDRTARAIVAYVESARTDLEDALALLQAHLAGVSESCLIRTSARR